MAGDSAECLVCRWPGKDGSEPCEHCGWQDGADVPATLVDEAISPPALAARQRDHDLRAAARAAGVAGARDEELLARLAGLARGAPPRASHIERAVTWADREDGHPATASAGMVFTLTRLLAGKCDAIGFVEIGPDAVSVQTLVTDRQGTPVRDVKDSLKWQAILPLLPTDTGLRYLRMAGGIGAVPRVPAPARGDAPRGAAPWDEDTGPAALIDAVDDAITPALTRLMAASTAAATMGRAGRVRIDVGGGPASAPDGPPHRVDIVLVRRTHRWPLLEEATTRARTILRPVAEIVVLGARTLAEIVDDIAVQAPLRYAYDLVLAEVNRQSGAVWPVTHELFPAGAQVPAGEVPPTRDVELEANDPDAGRVVLPVVARRGHAPDVRDLDAVRDRWPLVAMADIVTSGGPFSLRVRLRGPGRLELLAPPGQFARGHDSIGWPWLLAELPDRLPSASGELDLVLLVELGGANHTVARRVALVRGVVGEFQYEPTSRIAVLGYRDHFGKHRVDAIDGHRARAAEALVVGCGLSSPAGALSVLDQVALWAAVRVNDHHAAPSEDALRMLATTRFGWRPGARHVVVTVGCRPPHPARAMPQGDVMLPCPHRFSWQRSLERLRGEQAVECIAVLDDRRPDSQYARHAWDQLAAQGTTVLGNPDATPGHLKRAAGRTPARHAPLYLARLAGAASSPLAGKEKRP